MTKSDAILKIIHAKKLVTPSSNLSEMAEKNVLDREIDGKS